MNYLIQLFLTALAIALCVNGTTTHAANNRPNIIVIMSDDMGICVDVSGATYPKTFRPVPASVPRKTTGDLL